MKKARVSKTAEVNLLMLSDLGIEEAVHFQKVLQFSPGVLGALSQIPMASKLPLCISLISEVLYERTNEIILEKDNPIILDLACGYSPRVLKVCDEKHAYIGVDLPDVTTALTEHREELTGQIKESVKDYYNVDLTKYSELVSLMDNMNAPTTVITQALLTYLTLDQKQVLMDNIRSLLTKRGGCWVIPDAALARLLPEVFTAVLGSGAYSVYEQVIRVVDLAVKRDRNANGWQTTDEICDALHRNGFHVERVPLYTDSLELRSLCLLSEEQRQQVIANWRSTSSLIVTV